MEKKYCQTCGKKLVTKEIGDEGQVPFCIECNVPYFNHPVCCILVSVISQNRDVLLLKQNYVSSTNWGLIAGYLKIGENVEQAVVREVKEETGLDILKINYVNSYYLEQKEMIMLGFVAKAENMDFKHDSREVDDIKWEKIDNATNFIRSGSIAEKHLNNVIESMNKENKE